jgi:hypothetical protein
MNIDAILKDVENQSVALAQQLFNEYKTQALSDTDGFLQQSKNDLQTWMEQLSHGDIDKEDFTSLVKGQKELAEMHALKQAGLAQVSIDTFVNGVINIVINAAFSALKI